MSLESVERYVKDNNIKSYLDYDLDCEELEKYITIEEYEKEKKCNESIEGLGDYIYSLICNYNYYLAVQNEDIKKILSLIYGCEFEIEINANRTLDLIDLQEAYLGADYNEYKNFEDIMECQARLCDSYFLDYYGIEV